MGTTRYNVFSRNCPTRQVLDRIADKWTMCVVMALLPGTLRFSGLRREIEGVSQKMLTQTLRGLERDGMVRREVEATVPVTVRYTLTPLGRELAELVDPIRMWAYARMPKIESAREAYELASG